jgi:DNA replication protein DnaC
MIPERYLSRTLDNYRTETEGQAKALGHCRTFADEFKGCQKTGASLFMVGNAGAGKTHLACAIANQLIEHGHTALFLGVSKMFRRIRATYRSDSCQSEQDAIDALVRVDLLIIDEVGVQRGTESEEQLLFEVLNDRYEAYKPTILISNLPLDQARAYIGTRTLDRLRECGGKLIVFDWDSYRGRVRDDAELPAGSGVTAEPKPPGLRLFPEDD